MITFEELSSLNSYKLQKVVNQISDNSLIAVALKSTTEEFKKRFYEVMTKGRRELVEEEFQSIVSNRSEIEEAQEKIANIANNIQL